MIAFLFGFSAIEDHDCRIPYTAGLTLVNIHIKSTCPLLLVPDRHTHQYMADIMQLDVPNITNL